MTDEQATELLEKLDVLTRSLLIVEWASRVCAVVVPLIFGLMLWYYIRDAIRGRGLFGG